MKKEKEVVKLGVTKLSDFLKENNCYEEFINNFDKEFRYENWKRGDLGSLICAFGWGSNTQGLEYWDTLNTKWENLKHKENDMVEFFEDKELNKVTEDNEVKSEATSEVTRLQKKITNLHYSLSKKDEKLKNQALELSSLLSQKQHLQQQLKLEVNIKEEYTKSLIIIEYLESKVSNKLS